MVQQFRFEDTDIPDLKVIYPFVATDDRGYYMKYYEHNIFEKHGIFLTSHEEAQSKSQKGVIRGLHFQREYPQAKLVRAAYGKVFDVAVDLRSNSPTFGQWRGFFLSAENQKMLYIPAGFAHGLMALTENMLLSYMSGDDYSPTTDGGIRWDDSQLKINWPTEQVDNVVVSEKDKCLPSLEEYLQLHCPLLRKDSSV